MNKIFKIFVLIFAVVFVFSAYFSSIRPALASCTNKFYIDVCSGENCSPDEANTYNSCLADNPGYDCTLTSCTHIGLPSNKIKCYYDVCTAEPVNGSCSATHYNCSAGTSANNVSGETSWTWNCNGSNGGSNASCSEPKLSPPMTGTLLPTPSSCTILAGASSCPTTLDWETTYPEATSKVTSSYPAANTTIFNGNSGSQSVSIPHASSPRHFYLYNNNKSLVLTSESPNGSGITVTASCASGTVWNGTYCSSNPDLPYGTISADDCTILSGHSTCSDTNVSWETGNRIPGANTAVTKNNPNTNPPTIVSTATSGDNLDVTVNYGITTFFLYHNNLPPLDQTDITASCESGTTWFHGVCTPGETTDPIDGYWAGEWGECDKNGIQTKTYICIQPVNGGAPCPKPTPPDETQTCLVIGKCTDPATHGQQCTAGTPSGVTSLISKWTWTCLGSDDTVTTDDASCTELKKKPFFIEN